MSAQNDTIESLPVHANTHDDVDFGADDREPLLTIRDYDNTTGVNRAALYNVAREMNRYGDDDWPQAAESTIDASKRYTLTNVFNHLRRTGLFDKGNLNDFMFMVRCFSTACNPTEWSQTRSQIAALTAKRAIRLIHQESLPSREAS